MLEVVYGETKNQTAANLLVEATTRAADNGTLYLGYPILASVDETIFIDALLVSETKGLIIFDLPSSSRAPSSDADWDNIKDQQDKLFFSLHHNLGRHSNLRSGRELAFKISIITVLAESVAPPIELVDKIASPESLQSVIGSHAPIDPNIFRLLQAALQRVTTIRPPKKRSNVVRSGSKGSILQQIEKNIANLDRWQKKAAIESPEGPQRVRGLAGSGKTIVLALKASYLHTKYPEWDIVLTFHTRSLYQQLIELVRRFTYEHANDEPDFNKIHIWHSWGSMSKPGVYSNIANQLQVVPKDFLSAKTKYGMPNAFSGACSELLSISAQSDVQPIFDAVLIDEAQDLPKQFFRLVYRFTKSPKRIIWAYDELQNLSSTSMPTVADMFGTDRDGTPLVSLTNQSGQPRRDITLPVCYRNTHWALTAAHALGLGVYREGGLVQHPDEPQLWADIGYMPRSGSLEYGHNITLERRTDSYPSYFAEYLNSTDAISCHEFDDELAQIEWVASSIKRNISEDELDPDDILVILPDALLVRKKAPILVEALLRHEIVAHVVGVSSSQDEMFVKESVAISSIHRAKGNEAPMVYVLDSHYCMSGFELIKIRNIIFTAITRSRCWVRLSGYGETMKEFKKEFDTVVARGFTLQFKIPTQEELEKLTRLHRDRLPSEKENITQGLRGLERFLKLVEEGELNLSSLPASIREQLTRLSLSTQEDFDNDS